MADVTIDSDSEMGVYDAALLVAAANGHCDLIDPLVAAGADVNAVNYSMRLSTEDEKEPDSESESDDDYEDDDDDDETPLILATRHGHYECVETLLRHGANVTVTFRKWTLLMLASEKGYTRIVKLLLELGADVNRKEPYHGRSALWLAASAGYSEIIKLLLNYGADINITDEHNTTLLMDASHACDPQTIALYLKSGADVNFADECGWTSLMFSLCRDRNYRIEGRGLIYRLLTLDESNSILVGDKLRKSSGFFVIPNADHTFQYSCVKTLIETGANVNQMTKNGWTPIMIAAVEKIEIQIIEFLLQNGANVNATWKNRWSALASAILGKNPECVKRLIEAGADVNNEMCSTRNDSPFYKSSLGLAADMGNLMTIRLLLMSGAHTSSRSIWIYPETKDEVKTIMEAAGACSPDGSFDNSLQSHCREKIRHHLLEVEPPVNLYLKVLKLPLPTPVQNYLLYDMSLDED